MFLFKLLYVAKKQNVTSVADFISSRYGKRKNIALLASLVCLVVVVPYIALQLKAVSSSYQVLLGGDFSDETSNWWQDSAFLSAVAMAFFAILFGTRKLHLTEQSRGVMVAIAFESVVKLFAKVNLNSCKIWSWTWLLYSLTSFRTKYCKRHCFFDRKFCWWRCLV